MNRRIGVILAAALSTQAALFWGTIAANWQSAAAAEDPAQRAGVTATDITIGSCAPLSGQQKIRGAAVVEGGKTYFDYVNEQGGVNGRKLRLLSCDDKYNVDEGAINCFNNCLKGRVFMGALFQGTASAAKYVSMADSHHMPMLGFSTGGDFIATPVHPYAFQVRASYNDEATKQIDSLYKELGVTRIAIAYQNDAYGASCRQGVIRAMKKYSLTPVAEVSYPRLGRDADGVIAQLIPAMPQAVIIGGAGDMVALLVTKRKNLGSHVLMSSFSSSTDLLTDEAGKAADGTLLSQVLPLAYKDLPTVKLYNKLAGQRHEQPSLSGFEGFLIGMVTTEGFKRAGKDLTRDGFCKALETIHNFDMGLGPQFQLTFSPTQHDGLRGRVFMTTIKNGKMELIPNWNEFKAHLANK